MTERTKTITKCVVAALALAWGVVLTAQSCSPPRAAQQFQSGGGGPLGGGTGISKVTTNSPGLLAGSGTTANPLTATISQGSGIAGTGSSGDALRVGAGSGITVGADDVRVNAGSGLTADSTNLRINAGSGVTIAAGDLRADLGAQMTFSAGAIQPNLTGGTCSNGQGYTSLSSVGAGTCGTVEPNHPDGATYVYHEDFIQSVSCASQAMCGSMFGFTNSGTSASASSATQTATTRPGFMSLVPGTTANQLSMLRGAPGFDFSQYSSISLDCTVGFPTLSNSTDGYATIVGFGDLNTGIQQTNGCYMIYDERNAQTNGQNSGNAQKLECVCADNTGSPIRTVFLMDGSTVSNESFTTVNAPIAAFTPPSTNIRRLKVLMTGTTRAEFFVDGVKSCDINTHIPSGSTHMVGHMVAHVRNVGSSLTPRTDIDQCTLTYTMNAARSP